MLINNVPLFQDIFRFAKKPQYPTKLKATWSKKFWMLFRIISFSLLISFGLSFLISVILEKTGYAGENRLTDVLDSLPIVFLILGCVYAPIAEEIAFRGWLRAGKITLPLGISLLAYFAFNILLGVLAKNGLIQSYVSWHNSLEWYFLIALELLKVGGIFAILYLLFNKTTLLSKAENFIKKHFTIFFYTSVLTFGFAHITNYTQIKSIIWLLPLIISPQIVGGFCLGYIRSRFGLLYSIISHSIINFLPFSTTLFLQNISSETKEVLKTGGDITVVASNSDLALLSFTSLYVIFLILVILGVNIYNLVDYLNNKKSPSKRGNL